MSDRIAFFIGSKDAFNVQNIVCDLGKMLTEAFKIDLITTSDNIVKTKANEYYNIHDEGTSNIYGEYKSLKKYLNENSPNAIVQVTQPPVHGSLVGILSKLHNIPFVYRYSGDRFQAAFVRKGLNKVPYYVYNNIIGRLPIYFGDKFITLGPIGVKRLVERGIETNNIKILPPVVNKERFKSANYELGLDISSNRSIALFVGNRNYLKGMETIDRSIPKILDRRNDIQFIFVGDGDRVPNIPPKYKDHVTIIGPVDPNFMPKIYNTADFLIHPSLTEGVPLVLLESLATETPVIARNVGEIPSITDNTFENEYEFIEMVCNFENLKLDEIDDFYIENAKQTYQSFFNKIKEEDI